MTLALGDVRQNEQFELVTVPDEEIKARLRRLGLHDGVVECRRQLRGGPTIVRRSGTQLAIGAGLADRIEIERAEHQQR
ncbi:ferrous iron transport protein A [Halobaculum sp. MBLA0147]|uniref:FeoA family protein n=1 Tax=Halobaculum sp. MBLA0147 TaxID=3079934 RepID=UPI0035250CBC